MTNYEKEYQKKMEVFENFESNLKSEHTRQKEKIERIQSDDSLSEKEKEKALEKARKALLKNTAGLINVMGQKRFFRVGTDETELEKQEIRMNFCQQLRQILPKDCELCFHGCKEIYRVEEILKSGNISSTVDRFEYQTSMDTDDVVSVTTLASLDVTIGGYAGLDHSTASPAGAVFVLHPKDEEEIASSKNMVIGNVDFRENPERLVSIMTTSENQETVKNWCRENGFSDSVVCTFNEFLERANEFGTKSAMKK